jgi:hypothetical protein
MDAPAPTWLELVTEIGRLQDNLQYRHRAAQARKAQAQRLIAVHRARRPRVQRQVPRDG